MSQNEIQKLNEALREKNLTDVFTALKNLEPSDKNALIELRVDVGRVQENLLHFIAKQANISRFMHGMSGLEAIEKVFEIAGEHAAQMVMAPGNANRTPLIYAARFQNSESLKKLLSIVPHDVVADYVMQQDGRGHGAMHYALRDHKKDQVEPLVEALGEHLQDALLAKTAKGDTAISFALQNGTDGAESVQYLMAALGDSAKSLAQGLTKEFITRSVEDLYDAIAVFENPLRHHEDENERARRQRLQKALNNAVRDYASKGDFGFMATSQLELKLFARLRDFAPQRIKSYHTGEVTDKLRVLNDEGRLYKAISQVVQIPMQKLAVFGHAQLQRELTDVASSIQSVAAHARGAVLKKEFGSITPEFHQFHEGTRGHKVATRMVENCRVLIDDYLTGLDFSEARTNQLRKELTAQANKADKYFVMHRGGGVVANLAISLTGLGAIALALHALITKLKDGVARPFFKTNSTKQMLEMRRALKQMKLHEGEVEVDENVASVAASAA